MGALGCAPGVIHDCEPGEGITPVCGFQNPEDLAITPDGDWLIVSQYAGLADQGAGGSLVALDVADGTRVPLFGGLGGPAEFAGAGTGGPCPGPIPAAQFSPHGITVVDTRNQGALVLAVNHGARESVEFFHVDTRGERPSARWVGCVPLPPGVVANDVAPMPGSGFVVTNFMSTDPGLGDLLDGLLGRPSGNVLSWSDAEGWGTVPNSEMQTPNGIAASSGGTWLFVAEWGAERLVKMRKDGRSRESVDLGFRPDNVTWGPHRKLLVTGQRASLPEVMACGSLDEGTCAIPFVVAQVDARTLEVETVFEHDPATVGGAGTVAVQHRGRLWVGTFAGDRLLSIDRRS